MIPAAWLATLWIAQAEAPPPSGGWGQMILIFAVMYAGFYFLLIAPQRKKAREHQKMLGELKPGDEVLTSSGIFGKIVSVESDRFVLQVASGTRIEVAKAFVQNKLNKA